ncbi:MAG: hypothetical protein JOY64_04340 [Alphaproteobacteria bacterium]|nr:hypothetical protein [Alphaproteobacteria bacterium]
MVRPAALILVLLAASPAFASEAAERVEMRSGGAGLGFVAQAQRSTEPTGLGQHVFETSMGGLGWRQGGFSASTTAGLVRYDFSGAGKGEARAVSFALSHEIGTALGGKLAFELRQLLLFEAGSQTAITSARLGWSVKF